MNNEAQENSNLKKIALTACVANALDSWEDRREAKMWSEINIARLAPFVRSVSSVELTFYALFINGQKVGTVSGSAVVVGGVTFDRGDLCESASEASDVLFSLAACHSVEPVIVFS
tara:strand:- start:481 stop:828 length:348 start_codon:yes stop_codon:yes gene_type:complete